MSTSPDSTTTHHDDVLAQDVPTPAEETVTTSHDVPADTATDATSADVTSADVTSADVTSADVTGADADSSAPDEAVSDDADDADDAQDASSAEGGPATRRDRTEDLVREGEIAADFLEALLDIADLSGDLEVDIEGNRAAVAIVDSEDGVAPRRLVGPGGSVLDALQELARLAVQAETGERSRLMLDVAGYRSDRRAALVRTARRAIEEVKESGAPRELEPMTAFERKVVHDEVLAAGLHSESEGMDPSRYVVIQPAS